jgi:hypothetical protein
MVTRSIAASVSRVLAHPAYRLPLALGKMLTGFAVEGFVLPSTLVHMVPLTAALGMGRTRLLVASLFGPSQVASRFINILFGGRLPQTDSPFKSLNMTVKVLPSAARQLAACRQKSSSGDSQIDTKFALRNSSGTERIN